MLNSQVSINNFLDSPAAHFGGYLTAAAVRCDYGRGSQASRCSPEGRFGRAVGWEISARSQSALPDESHSPAVLLPSLRMHGILILEKVKSWKRVILYWHSWLIQAWSQETNPTTLLTWAQFNHCNQTNTWLVLNLDN